MRGKGEASVFRDKNRGLWVATIELPSHDGKRRRKTIRAKDKSVLLGKLDKLKTQLRASGDLATSSMTVAVWLDYWMREIAAKTRRPKTVASYRSIVDNWVVPAIGKTRMDKVTPSTIRKVFTLMQNPPATEKTPDPAPRSSTYQRNAHAVMSAAFADAERDGLIGRNPVDLVVAPVRAVTDLDVLTPDEAVALLGRFRESPDAFLWATFLLTGARRGEILGLEWDRVTDELDLSWQLQRLGWSHGCRGQCPYKQPGACPRRKLDVPADFEYRPLEGGLYLTRPKTRAGWRVVPLVDPLASILARWKKLAPENPYGLVFTAQRPAQRPIDPDDATSAWPTALKAAGIDRNVRLHDLRHTTVDLLYAADVREDLVEEIVGHSSRTMSRAYKSRGNRERLRAAMLQLSASLGYTAE